MDESSFPLLETKNYAVILTGKGERAVRSEHPWVFESSIAKLDENAKAGDKAIIYDKRKNKFLALGLIDPHSPIRLKMLAFKKSMNIDQAFFISKFEDALAIRKPLLETDTNSFRLIYGENDKLPGLIVDIYADVAVVKLYSHIWFPYLLWIVQAIKEVSKAKTLVLRLSRALQKNAVHPELKDGSILYGKLEDETIVFREHGILFSANVIHGHKTGYFLDHRENRRKVGILSDKSKNVLDVFSYAGGFSIHALVGGAKTVTSVDISKQALKLAEGNAALNGTFNNHITLAGDAFNIMQNLAKDGKKYELIVVDPPSFAKAASEVETAIKSYERLTRLAIKLAARNATLVLASCSSRVTAEMYDEIIEQQFNRQNRKYRILERSRHDVDHPVTFKEGAYLKCIYIQMEV